MLRPVLLIIDHEPDIATTLQQFLGQRFPQVDVESVTSLREADEFLKKRRVDVLLVDHHMPTGNGIEFLERLRREKPDIPAVMITANTNPQVLSDAVNRAHVDGFFIKPLDETKLVESLERLLKKRRGTTNRIPWRPLFGPGREQP